jgi:hypothetical protein
MSEREYFHLSPAPDKSAAEMHAHVSQMIDIFGDDRVCQVEDGSVFVYATRAELSAMFDALDPVITLH